MDINKQGYLLICCVIILLSFFPSTNLEGAEISFSLSVTQGFNFDINEQLSVGHITSLTIGTTELNADLSVTDPEFPNGDTIKVACVISAIFWSGGFADPIQFSCQVSNDNKQALEFLVDQTLSNTDVQFSFNVYDWDLTKQKYYKAFHTNGAALYGFIENQGGELNMTIDPDQSMEVAYPINFKFTLGVMPAELAQFLHHATSVSDKFVKQWGVAVSGGGDINTDGVVDLVDVILSLQILTHTTPQSNITLTGDVDNDQNIGVAEAIYGLRSVAGLLP
jgi:hypothetical protein